jgi:hypothetical protein
MVHDAGEQPLFEAINPGILAAALSDLRCTALDFGADLVKLPECVSRDRLIGCLVPRRRSTRRPLQRDPLQTGMRREGIGPRPIQLEQVVDSAPP